MAEWPTVAPEPDVLLATKLHMPAARPGQVLRPRLTAQLDEGAARGLALVCAPAGCGKTVLLADWARRGEQPTAWLSLDAGDNDPARFWRHAVAALARARPGIAERVSPLLGPPAPASFQGLVTALINDLAGQPSAEQARLVLDDYHVIGSHQVHQSLGFLLQHRPAGLCMVLASRSDPPLGLARLRARGQLAEIREAELRFTPVEAAELLAQAASGLPETSVAALAVQDQGWAAGLWLAALSLRGQHDADAAAFVAAFTGSHRYVLDYLAEEVLERQDEQLRTFLLETSVLERLSGPLCNAVTGREDSQALLEQAERAGLFLIPLDEVRGWWRYHHLFADLLQARLRQEQPGRAAQLHRHAAAWYAGHDLADDAIGHAAAAGEMLWAARAAAAAARIGGLVLLYYLRFALAAPETARGLRRMVLDATPLPALPKAPSPETIEPPCTKKAVLLALYRAHPDYGDRGRASRVAAELAPQAGLQPGTARSYLYAELDGRPS